MKLHFIEYLGDIYIVLGITYDQQQDCPECFVAVPLEQNVYRSMLNIYTTNIPFNLAREISDENTLKSLLILYG